LPLLSRLGSPASADERCERCGPLLGDQEVVLRRCRRVEVMDRSREAVDVVGERSELVDLRRADAVAPLRVAMP